MESEVSELWSAHPTLDDRPTNLELQLEHACFHVHKDVLEASCDYFRAMFHSSMIEQSKQKIKLHCVNCAPFKILLEAFYTGHIQSVHDIEVMYSVAETAQMLQVNTSLHNQCLNFFKDTINNDNCFQIMHFSFEFSMQDIYNYARRFCLTYFINLWHTPSFLELTEGQLVAYLSDDKLCVDHEAEVLEAVRLWVKGHTYDQNPSSEIIFACVRLKDNPKALAIAKQAVMNTDEILFENGVPDIFSSRHGMRDVLMFWSLLTSTNQTPTNQSSANQASGLVDVVRLCTETSQGVHHDSMSRVLEVPGFDVGSAVCSRGPYVYVSGGGPGFGKVNWIKKLWRFDSSRATERWSEVGSLTETRRYHAMVAIGQCLYLFGGFGKYRMRNSSLDSFNLDTGSWTRLSPMPTHTTSPVTTTHHHRFFYIDSLWDIYAFNTSTNTWITVNHSVPLTSMPTTPVAMHFLSSNQGEKLLVVSHDEGLWSVCEMCWTAEPGTMIPANVELCDCEGTVRHCVVDSGRLLVFVERKYEEEYEGEEKEKVVWEVKAFEPRHRKLSDWLTIQNIRKAQNIVTVPQIPLSFQISL